MNLASTSSVLAPQLPRRRKRWRVVLALVALLILTPLCTWFYFDQQAKRDWEQAVAEADRLDPRWRLHEIEEDRPNVPDAENSAPKIAAVGAKFRTARLFNAPSFEYIFKTLPATAQLNAQQVEVLTAEFAKIGKTRDDARLLKDMPRGRFSVTFADNWIETPTPHHEHVRATAFLLQWDAHLLAQEGKYDDAFESCQVILNVGRALNGEPVSFSDLVRTNTHEIAITALERVLAQGAVSDETLRSMQSALLIQSKENNWLSVARAERAGLHHLCENLRAGKVQFSGLTQGRDYSRTIEDWWVDTRFAGALNQYPELLRLLNRWVAIADLRIHEREAKYKEFWADYDNEDSRKLPRELQALVGLTSGSHRADVRIQALLRSAAVALACERYRLKHKDNTNENAWPASLELLVKDKLIEAIPLDPIDGQPMRYRRTKDGIVAYSIGFDKKDDQGNIDRDRPPADPGFDIGFRL